MNLHTLKPSLILLSLFLSVSSTPAQWVQTSGQWGGRWTTSLIVSGTDLLTGTGGLGVLRSGNAGATWSFANCGLASDEVLALAIAGSNMYAGTYGYGVYRSSNNGASWVDASAGLTGKNVYALSAANSVLLAGTDSGVFRSTDIGGHWLAADSGMRGKIVSTFAAHDLSLFAGMSDATVGGGGAGGVFLSTDDRVSWTDVSAGLPGMAYVRSLAVSGAKLFAATNGAGIWRRPLSEMITSLQTGPGDAPAAFRLDQNYPNPFNPVTTIRFALPSRSRAMLEIFNGNGLSSGSISIDSAWKTGQRRRC